MKTINTASSKNTTVNIYDNVCQPTNCTFHVIEDSQKVYLEGLWFLLKKKSRRTIVLNSSMYVHLQHSLIEVRQNVATIYQV